jgi:hypothetical protein
MPAPFTALWSIDSTRGEQDAGEFAVAKAVVERLEPIKLLAYYFSHPWRSCPPP